MNARRLAIYLALLLALLAIGLGLAFWAVAACAPPSLPGDEIWTLRRNFGEALSLVLRAGSKACFTNDGFGTFGLWLGGRTALAVLLALVAIVVWEAWGRHLRRAWFRARGGHVVLAGTHDDMHELAVRQGALAGTFFIAPDRAAAIELSRHRPFAEIVPVDTRRLPQLLRRLGVTKAKLLVAATHSDVTNVAIAEAGLAAPAAGEIMVRLEQPAVRNLSSHRLRIAAAAQDCALSVVSLTQLQTRRGMAAAMSGRYSLDGAPRVHIALCGSGPGLQAASFEVARQGFGLEREKPLLSILRTGSSDFAAGALSRLQTSAAAEVQISDIAAEGLDRAIGAILEDAPPLLAVHCIGEVSGEAEAMALRWEEVLLGLRQPIPPIIAYAGIDRPLGATGMIRVATSADLVMARETATLMDRRAQAVHRHYLDQQRLARGAKFGTAPAEVEWTKLPESYQDDNRNVADQMDYKLASVLMLAEPGEAGATLDRDEIEVLSGIAHARWMASKALAGWRYAPERDNRQMTHPDLVPYSELNEIARQKDRDEVTTLSHMAALAGETLLRERRIGLPRELTEEGIEHLLENLRQTPKAFIPVIVLPLDDAGMVRLAAALVDKSILLEALLDRWTDGLRGGEVGDTLAHVLRHAWRIHVVRSADARADLPERVDEYVDESGAVDVLAP